MESFSEDALVFETVESTLHQAPKRTAAKPGHGQCFGHDVICHTELQRPANDLAVEQVKNDGQ